MLRLKDATGGPAFMERAQWLLRWLEFEQLGDGAWMDQKYETPKKSAAATCHVTSELIEVSEGYPGVYDTENMISKAGAYILSQYRNGWMKTLESSTDEDYRTDAACLPALEKLGGALGDERYTAAAAGLAARLVSAQNSDGSWPYGTFSTRATVNSQAAILEGLAEYYETTGDQNALASVKSGARWLSQSQEESGRFRDYVVEETGRTLGTEKSSYPKAAYVYGIAGMDSEKQKTLEYISRMQTQSKVPYFSNDLEALVQLMGVSK
jgi:uncharacterized protein YyaL (SSP411 family)